MISYSIDDPNYDPADAGRDKVTSDYTYAAISHCQDSIKRHQKSIVTIWILIICLLVGLFSFFILENSKFQKNSFDIVTYGIYLISIGVISILYNLYKSHLREFSKAEQNIVEFYRIGIAGNEGDDHFNSEVRKALTNKALYNEEQTTLLEKGRNRIKNPIPGHPTSDILTHMLNKIPDFKPLKKSKS